MTFGFSDHAVSVDKKVKNLVFLRSNFNMPAALYRWEIDRGEPVAIEHFNDALRAGSGRNETSPRRVTAAGDGTCNGGADAGKRHSWRRPFEKTLRVLPTVRPGAKRRR